MVIRGTAVVWTGVELRDASLSGPLWDAGVAVCRWTGVELRGASMSGPLWDAGVAVCRWTVVFDVAGVRVTVTFQCRKVGSVGAG